MPNLYITNNSTSTTVGLTASRKTTPSLVVTCGNTTYYGGLTTCADWATSPNKIVVTSGSTTYYTMAPAKGTKFVNFVVPTQCSQVSGTILTKCCSGYLGRKDRAAGTLTACCKVGYGSYGNNNTSASTSNCYKILSYDSPDTTISHQSFVYPSLGHTHTTGLVFDDNTCLYSIRFCSRHKGVKIYCNYNTAPDYIYAFYNCTTGIANSGWEYLYVNGSDQCQTTTHICAIACRTAEGKNGGWNTNGVTSSNYGYGEISCVHFSSYATGPNLAALLNSSGVVNPYITHYQFINASTATVVAKDCCIGDALPIFEINMACYDHDIDKLPTCTILLTNCPLSCFNTDCWATPTYMGQATDVPYVNRKRTNIIEKSRSVFCLASPVYYGANANYNGTFSNYGMWPWTCSGSVGNCTYKPIMSVWHNHTSNSNSGVYGCFEFLGTCLPLVNGGSCFIVHR